MSAIKRAMEDFVDSLCRKTGYNYDYLLDKFMYYVANEGLMTLQQFKTMAMQKAFDDSSVCDVEYEEVAV